MPHSPEHMHAGSEGARSGQPTGQRPSLPEMERDNSIGEFGGTRHTGTFLGADETHMYISPLAGTGADSTDARRIPKGSALTGNYHSDVKALMGKRVSVDVEDQMAGRDGRRPEGVAGRFNVIGDDGKPDMGFYNQRPIGRMQGRSQEPLMSDPSTQESKDAMKKQMREEDL